MIDCKNLSKNGYVVLILLSIFHILPIPAFAEWQTTTVGIGTGPIDIAVDSNGRAHISYSRDIPAGSLDYASNVTGAWTTTNVAAASWSPQVGVYNSIGVDSNGKAHISYINTDNTLNYAENISGSWTRMGLTSSAGNTGNGVSIAVDSNNKEHIAYIDKNVYGNSCLKYATNASGSWATSTLGTCDSTSYAASPAIAVDSSTKVHISYTGLNGLQYATNVSGSWVTSTVDGAGGGGYTSIAIDSNNKAHISYRTTYISITNIFKYATNASGTWVTTTLDNSEGSSSIAVDSNNKIHIAYNKALYGSTSIIYATNISGIWINTTTDTGYVVSPAIALDSYDRPHISYSATYFDLRYAGSMDYSVKYVYDGLTGSVAINSGAAYTNSTSAILSLSCVYSGIGCAEMKFSDDDTNWSTTEPYSTTKSYTLSSGDGTKTVYVKFKDANGNWSKSYNGAIILDTAVPNTTIYSNPPNTSWYASFGVGSSEGGSSFQCQLDGSGYGSCTGTVACSYSYCTSSISYAGLTEGPHTFDVRAIDSAGNTDATPASYTWTIDTTAPAGTLTINSGAASTNSTTATLTLSCTDTNGCAQMQFSNDNSTYSTAEASATSKTWTLSSGDGTKTVYVKFKDGAGNWSNAFSDTIMLDSAAPDTSITSQPSSPTNSTSASFTFSSTESGSTFQCKLDAGGYSSCTSPKSYTGLTAGSHTFYVKATDAAGNTDVTPASYTWTVDTTAPMLNATATYVDSTHINVTFSEAVNGATVVSNYTANNGLTISGVSSQGGNTYRLTTSIQAIGGSYTITANNITDLAGNAISSTSKTATFTRTANSAPSTPVISSPANGSEVIVTVPTLFVNASTEPDGDNLGYRFEVSTDSSFATVNATAYVSYGMAAHTTASWTVSPALNDNTLYYWRVQASDGVLNSNWTTTASFFINTANDAPTAPGISSPANGAQVSSPTPSLSVTNSTDVDNDVLTYSFDVATDSGFTNIIAGTTGTAQGSGTTSWTVGTTLNDNTTYYWRARATDEHGATSGYATGSFFVNTANDAPTTPVISSPAAASEVTTLTPSLVITNSTDADHETLSYIFEIDTVNTFNSANRQTSPLIASGSDTTSWTPAALNDNTTYYWRAKANDGQADSGWMTTASFFVNTINDAPTVPTLNNPANNAGVTTLTPSLIVNAATDIDNDALIYDFEVYSNSGLTSLVASATGQGTSWIVPASSLSDNTTYYWRARAKDEHGLAGNWMAANSFFVNNNGINDPPSVSVINPGASEPATKANTFTIQWTATDPDSNPVITLYYDTTGSGHAGTVIVTGLHKDDPSSTYTWDTSTLPSGTYYVYAKIDDGTTINYAYGAGPIMIDRTAPVTTPSLIVGGTYTSARSVTLTCNDGTGSGCNKIYYTTNGTTPTTSSTTYTGPIGISTDTTLKFFAVDNAGNAGTVLTETYVITAMNAIDTTPPANASNLNATSNSDGSVSISWTAPTDSDLKGYNVYRDGTKINNQAVTASSYKDSSVTIGSTYTYKVTSLDLAGNESSGVTKTATSTVQANTPPSTPVNVKAEDTGTGYSMKVVWPANTESDMAGYKVYWGTASGTYANSHNVGNATSYTIPGLTEGTRYYVAVTAYDTDGNESAKSIEVTGTPKAYASRPDVPTSMTVTPGNKYLTLSWTGVSNITGYMVYIGEADGVYGTPVRTTNTTHTFQNLENNKTYYVAVSSYDLNSGSRYTISSESEKTTSSGTPYDNEPPAAPSGLTATDAGIGGKIVLKWAREESFDIAGYVVAYKNTGNSAFEGITSTGVTWNYAVTGLTNGQSYTFYLYAYDANGNFSDPSSVTAIPTGSGSTVDVTPPGIPTLSAAPGNGKVTLMITPPSDTDIAHYNLYVYNLAAGKYMPLASINGLSYEHSTGVDNGKALVFVATAVDASGNESGYSAPANAVPNELPGDISLEEDPPVLDRVDGYDVNEIAKGFGSSIGKPNYNPNADLDGNGIIDGNDLLILGTNHGKKK